jgi:pantothenate kinase
VLKKSALGAAGVGRNRLWAWYFLVFSINGYRDRIDMAKRGEMTSCGHTDPAVWRRLTHQFRHSAQILSGRCQ